MTYGVPGGADTVSQEVLAAWNTEINRQFDRLFAKLPEAVPFLLRNPDDILNGTPTDTVHWPGDPAEPRFCLDRAWAEKLCNWGVRGRHSFHDEYCEYTLIQRADQAGRVRPKRVVATTELPEYWLTVATVDPDLLQRIAADALGWTPAYTELYGPEGSNPHALAPQRRRVLFAMYTGGNGLDPALVQVGVPRDPIGDLNRRNVLFMSHPINGLDDLIYIVMFGARPYAVGAGANRRLAQLHEIFRFEETEYLACRNADSSAAAGAYAQIIKEVQGNTARGCQIAFANPLGMYMGPFDDSALTYNDQPIPQEWIKKSRGRPGMEQRFEFGPPDDHPAFLDEITIEEGANRFALNGGYQLLRRFEVGPHLVLGQDREFAPQWKTITASPAPLVCSQAAVCMFVNREREAYENEHSGIDPRGIA